MSARSSSTHSLKKRGAPSLLLALCLSPNNFIASGYKYNLLMHDSMVMNNLSSDFFTRVALDLQITTDSSLVKELQDPSLLSLSTLTNSEIPENCIEDELSPETELFVLLNQITQVARLYEIGLYAPFHALKWCITKTPDNQLDVALSSLGYTHLDVHSEGRLINRSSHTVNNYINFKKDLLLHYHPYMKGFNTSKVFVKPFSLDFLLANPLLTRPLQSVDSDAFYSPALKKKEKFFFETLNKDVFSLLNSSEHPVLLAKHLLDFFIERKLEAALGYSLPSRLVTDINNIYMLHKQSHSSSKPASLVLDSQIEAEKEPLTKEEEPFIKCDESFIACEEPLSKCEDSLRKCEDTSIAHIEEISLSKEEGAPLSEMKTDSVYLTEEGPLPKMEESLTTGVQTGPTAVTVTRPEALREAAHPRKIKGYLRNHTKTVHNRKKERSVYNKVYSTELRRGRYLFTNSSLKKVRAKKNFIPVDMFQTQSRNISLSSLLRNICQAKLLHEAIYQLCFPYLRNEKHLLPLPGALYLPSGTRFLEPSVLSYFQSYVSGNTDRLEYLPASQFHLKTLFLRAMSAAYINSCASSQSVPLLLRDNPVFSTSFPVIFEDEQENTKQMICYSLIKFTSLILRHFHSLERQLQIKNSPGGSRDDDFLQYERVTHLISLWNHFEAEEENVGQTGEKEYTLAWNAMKSIVPSSLQSIFREFKSAFSNIGDFISNQNESPSHLLGSFFQKLRLISKKDYLAMGQAVKNVYETTVQTDEERIRFIPYVPEEVSVRKETGESDDFKVVTHSHTLPVLDIPPLSSFKSVTSQPPKEIESATTAASTMEKVSSKLKGLNLHLGSVLSSPHDSVSSGRQQTAQEKGTEREERIQTQVSERKKHNDITGLGKWIIQASSLITYATHQEVQALSKTSKFSQLFSKDKGTYVTLLFLFYSVTKNRVLERDPKKLYERACEAFATNKFITDQLSSLDDICGENLYLRVKEVCEGSKDKRMYRMAEDFLEFLPALGDMIVKYSGNHPVSQRSYYGESVPISVAMIHASRDTGRVGIVDKWGVLDGRREMLMWLMDMSAFLYYHGGVDLGLV